jgi:site-specific recombinase XerD
MFDPASVRFRGLFLPYVEGFFAELRRQGYAPLSAANLLRAAVHFERWLDTHGRALVDISEDVVAAFLRHRRRRGYTHFLSRRAFEPLLGYLRGIGVVPISRPVPDETPLGRFLHEYAEYLAGERGLTETSVHAYSDFARRFVLDECRSLDWEGLSAADIIDFTLREVRGSSLAGRKLMVSHLRSLLRFLHLRGATAQDLVPSVPAVAGWSLSSVPKALDHSQIRRLLASFDRSPVGVRDAAIVRLLLRLGLRAGEVVALTLDSVDWRSGEISVHGKGRHLSRLPLPADVGRILARYVRNVRSRVDTRALFLRSRAPYRGMLRSGITAVAFRALRRAGVLAGSAHVLRHTAATELLRHGASLSEIAHVLRHRRVETTAIYAKVDLASLRTLARPWPGGEP